MYSSTLNNQMDIDSESFAVIDNQYTVIKKIGSGATCKVKLAKDKESGEIVAVKILNSKGSKLNSNDKHFHSEIDNLKKINHPNIINLKDGKRGTLKKMDGRSKTIDYIVLEYAANGELFDYLFFPKKGFGEYFSRYLFNQLIDGLEACHTSGVAHRDLKTENIMMDKNWTLKIADFGYATLLQGKKGDGLLTTPLGTLSYCCPEILNKKPYSGICADIFSCGVILFVLVTGKLPFGKAVVYDSYYRNIVKNDFEAYWAIMNPKIGEVSNEFRSLINFMLCCDPTQRPSIDEIRNHSWMSLPMPTQDEITHEFEQRKVIVTKMKQLEAEEEEKKKKGYKAGVYKAEDEAEVNEEPCLELFKEERRVELFIDSSNPYRFKVNETDVLKVLNQLASLFNRHKGSLVKLTPSETQAKFRVAYELDQDTLDSLPDLAIENLEIDVEVKKGQDESLVVELIKVGGDKMEFFNEYENLVESLKSSSSDEITESA